MGVVAGGLQGQQTPNRKLQGPQSDWTCHHSCCIIISQGWHNFKHDSICATRSQLLSALLLPLTAAM